MLHLRGYKFVLIVAESKVNEVTYLALLLIKIIYILDSVAVLPKCSIGKTCFEIAFWNLIISSHP